MAEEPGNESHVEVASIKNVKPQDVKKLLAEIDELRAKLELSEAQRTEVEKAALAQAESTPMMGGAQQEIPTGKTVPLQRCAKYKVVGYKEDGREIRKPVFEAVDVPTFYYKIDLPEVGGIDLKTNGIPLMHGQVVELDLDSLRSVKERVFRLWQHQASLQHSNENAYRKPVNAVFAGGGRVR